MRDADAVTIRLEDYQPSPYLIDEIALVVSLDPTATIVAATSSVRRTSPDAQPFELRGDQVDLQSVAINGEVLPATCYRIEPGKLIIPDVPAVFRLDIVNRISPAANTALQGLYMSSGRYCTQCEAEGFRAITFALDRPDVLSRYAVRIEADKTTCPILLANGNRTESGDLGDGRHYAVWVDPHPKPSYLFALVAGVFDQITDSFVTNSGRKVDLAIYVDPGDAERARYAMDSLKHAMRWDEEVFGREYDLDLFNIVAVRDFNFGAMENKGLNVFNSSLILADADRATDADFEAIEAVVGHEYFHNWTGNRITCRDWFQLCLKEGLTVFREQEFSADQRSRPVQRIKDVKRLRARQFMEDAGPLAHPVRPAFYQKIDNFYTATVYEKGGEVIRMLKRLVGDDAFARGMQIYFDTCDGSAATVEDFIACFEKASGQSLTHFMHWYNQAGTPRVKARGEYDAAAKRYALTLTQSTPPTPGQPTKAPLPIPLALGFISESGAPVFARREGETEARAEHAVTLNEATATITFEDVDRAPIPALLRSFSAPVILDDGLSVEQRLVQMAHDPDPFTRWEAGQSLARGLTLGDIAWTHAEALTQALGRELERAADDPAFAALTLRLPDVPELLQVAPNPDPDALHREHTRLRATITEAHKEKLRALAAAPAPARFSPDAASAGERALKSAALDLLSSLGEDQSDLLFHAFVNATCMTETIAALNALGAASSDAFDEALSSFESRWRDAPLVMDKWYAVQAAAPRDDAIERVARLRERSDFELRNPNRVRALAASFGMRNPRAFHSGDGRGYAFIGTLVREIDPQNPSLAARLLTMFETWRRFDPQRQSHAQAELSKLLETRGLSRNAAEVIERTLA